MCKGKTVIKINWLDFLRSDFSSKIVLDKVLMQGKLFQRCTHFLYTIMWIFKAIKIKCFYLPRILDEHWCIYFWLQIPPGENWFQYVHRVYTTAINFPCISNLVFDRTICEAYCNPFRPHTDPTDFLIRYLS